jgi:hypothetical protein
MAIFTREGILGEMDNLELATEIVLWALFLLPSLFFLGLAILLGVRDKFAPMLIAFVIAHALAFLPIISDAYENALWDFAKKTAIFYFEQCDKMGTIGVWASIIGGIIAPITTGLVFVIRHIKRKKTEK